MQEDEHRLQTESYRRDGIHYEGEEGKDGESMGKNTREKMLTTTM